MSAADLVHVQASRASAPIAAICTVHVHCRPLPTVTRGGDATTKTPTKKPKKREKVIIPTPEEWAQQQLVNAPHRSEEWARRVAQIYCLDLADTIENKTV